MTQPLQQGDTVVFEDEHSAGNNLNGCLCLVLEALPVGEIKIQIISPYRTGRKVFYNDKVYAVLSETRAKQTLSLYRNSLDVTPTNDKYYKVIRKIRQLNAAFDKRQKDKLK